MFLNLTVALHAQYAINSWTVAGGGGASSGGDYRLDGSMGQPDAGSTLTGGVYAVLGGYWAAVGVDLGPAPTLTIQPGDPGQLRISWAPDSSGWILQESLSVSPFEWVNVSAGTASPVVISAGESARFYRLMRSQ